MRARVEKVDVLGWTKSNGLSFILHVVKIVESLTSKFNIMEGCITIVCDILDGIKIAPYQFSSFSYTSNHFDILTAIHNITEESNITWRWRHKKVRQDNHIVPLDMLESLNVLCKTLAMPSWEDDQDLRYSQPRMFIIQNKGWRVFVEPPPICKAVE